MPDTKILKDELDLNALYDLLEAELLHGEIYVKYKPYVPKRSVLQNDLFWSYMTDLAPQHGVTKDQMSVIIKDANGMVEWFTHNGVLLPIVKSTTELNVKEFSDLLREVEIWASENKYTLFAPSYREDAMR